MPSEKAAQKAREFLKMINWVNYQTEEYLANMFDQFAEDCNHLHDPVLEKIWDNPEDEDAYDG